MEELAARGGSRPVFPPDVERAAVGSFRFIEMTIVFSEHAEFVEAWPFEGETKSVFS